MSDTPDMIIVTEWEKIKPNNFYLTNRNWLAEKEADVVKKAVELQKQGGLFFAYLCEAVDFCVYDRLTATEVFINKDCEVIMELECDGAVIKNKNWEHIQKTDYI